MKVQEDLWQCLYTQLLTVKVKMVTNFTSHHKNQVGKNRNSMCELQMKETVSDMQKVEKLTEY